MVAWPGSPRSDKRNRGAVIRPRRSLVPSTPRRIQYVYIGLHRKSEREQENERTREFIRYGFAQLGYDVKVNRHLEVTFSNADAATLLLRLARR